MDDETTTSTRPRAAAKSKRQNSEPTISHAIQGKIGEQLRAMYDDLKAEPIPDRLLDLIRQLDKPGSDNQS